MIAYMEEGASLPTRRKVCDCLQGGALARSTRHEHRIYSPKGAPRFLVQQANSE